MNSKILAQFCENNEEAINELYVDRHFETVGHGGDYDPLDEVDEKLWLTIAEEMWYNVSGGNNV